MLTCKISSKVIQKYSKSVSCCCSAHSMSRTMTCACLREVSCPARLEILRHLFLGHSTSAAQSGDSLSPRSCPRPQATCLENNPARDRMKEVRSPRVVLSRSYVTASEMRHDKEKPEGKAKEEKKGKVEKGKEEKKPVDAVAEERTFSVSDVSNYLHMVSDCAKKTSKCAKETPKCAKETTKCAKETPKCAKETTECAKETSKCAKETSECAKETTECAEETSKCAKETSECAKETTECAKETPKCAKKTSKCAKETTECAKETTECAKETPKCAKETPKCAKETSKCAEETPKCAKETSKCAKETSECAEETSECAKETAESKEDECEELKEMETRRAAQRRLSQRVAHLPCRLANRRLVQTRESAPVIEYMRDFFLGRKYNSALREPDELAPRTGPPPCLPLGPHFKYAENYYCTRDGAREVKPPTVIEGKYVPRLQTKAECEKLRKKMICDAKKKIKSKQ